MPRCRFGRGAADVAWRDARPAHGSGGQSSELIPVACGAAWMQVYSNVHFNSKGAAQCFQKGTQVRRYKQLVAKLLERANLQSAAALYVPLLHFRRKTAAFRSLPPWVCDPESAAFGCNKSTNDDEQCRLSTTDAPPIRGSALFVAIRPLSWLFAFTLTESFLCACNLACRSGILLRQCAFQNMNGPPNWSRWLKH